MGLKRGEQVEIVATGHELEGHIGEIFDTGFLLDGENSMIVTGYYQGHEHHISFAWECKESELRQTKDQTL